jgi:hypothetical protein
VTVKLERLVAHGDTVIALTQLRVGDETAHGADVFTTQDGKTVRVQAHPDTALIARVFGTNRFGLAAPVDGLVTRGGSARRGPARQAVVCRR